MKTNKIIPFVKLDTNTTLKSTVDQNSGAFTEIRVQAKVQQSATETIDTKTTDENIVHNNGHKTNNFTACSNKSVSEIEKFNEVISSVNMDDKSNNEYNSIHNNHNIEIPSKNNPIHNTVLKSDATETTATKTATVCEIDYLSYGQQNIMTHFNGFQNYNKIQFFKLNPESSNNFKNTRINGAKMIKTKDRNNIFNPKSKTRQISNRNKLRPVERSWKRRKK